MIHYIKPSDINLYLITIYFFTAYVSEYVTLNISGACCKDIKMYEEMLTIYQMQFVQYISI